jgi:hypothetical protein
MQWPREQSKWLPPKYKMAKSVLIHVLLTARYNKYKEEKGMIICKRMGQADKYTKQEANMLQEFDLVIDHLYLHLIILHCWYNA